MSNSKRIPQADTTKDSRVSLPRNPESVTFLDQPSIKKSPLDIPIGVLGQEPITKPDSLQEYDPAKIDSIRRGSLTDLPESIPFEIPGLRDPRSEFDNRDPNLFDNPPRTQLSVDDRGSIVIKSVDEEEPPVLPERRRSIPADQFDPESRRRAPPPVSSNPLALSRDRETQIPLAPGLRNFPKEWQNLPLNFQNQVRRLLPIFYDVTGPNANIRPQVPYELPDLFASDEPFEPSEDFDKDLESINSGQLEPPNRSSLDLINLLQILFNLINSTADDDIDSDIYEVVVFTRIEDETPAVSESEEEPQSDSGPESEVD